MPDLIAPRSLGADLEALADGALSHADYLELICDRIEACEPEVHAFVPEPGRRDRLRSTPVRMGTLSGVPVGIKDVIGVAGLPTLGGSTLPPDSFAPPPAVVVDRLLAAGALVAGKTVTAEFAVGAPGPTTNPYDPRHTPGGSSSGSAAAVAAGMVPLAIGTQTIGSVIRPAAYCGVVGYRSTFGRIPTHGVIANAPTLDTVGIFAGDVAGATVAAQILCDGWEVGRVPPERPPVLAVPDGPLLHRASAEAQEAFAGHVDRLRRHGVTVRTVPALADFDELAAQLGILNRYELARTHAERYPRWRDDFRPETVRAIEEGLTYSAEQYAGSLRWRSAFVQRFSQTMVDAGVDLWVSPSTTGPAPRGLHHTGDAVMCFPYSLAGLPAVTLPAGLGTGGLPLGLQLAGRLGQDEQLLGWAVEIEAALLGSG